MPGTACSRCGLTEFDIGTRTHKIDLCNDCHNLIYTECSCCGDFVLRETSYVCNEEYVCDDCYNENCIRCAVCDELFWRDNEGDFWDYNEDDDPICHNCNEIRRNSDPIHNYNYKPNPIFHKSKKDKNNPHYYGIELEVECRGIASRRMPSRIARNFLNEFNLNNEKILYIKRDGSLENGFEIVTHPMTIFAHKHFDWKRKLSWLVNNGCKSDKVRTCGLHIHTGIYNLRQFDWAKLVIFFRICADQLLIVSRRDYDSFHSWAHLATPSFIDKIKSTKRFGNDGHHNALSLYNRKTAEIRLFKGTLVYKDFINSIYFVDAIINFAHNYSWAFFNNPKNNHIILWNQFTKYTERHYPELYKMLEANMLTNRRV